jgi:UDP-N-acetylmuramyl pentapeptide phosphotransferase/UDP-N-acetylglucosamine-1-phosphate transferase
MRRRRSQTGLVLAGGVVILAGVAVGLVELLHFPKGSVWVVVALTVAVVSAIMKLSGR